MSVLRHSARALVLGAAVVGLSGVALADDESRQFGWSITLGGTSDYVFRGMTQTSEDPAAQGSLDLSYGLLYAGIWGSNIDFDGGGSAEIDLYAGIKPVWGPVTFDLGVIYYAYPGGDSDADLEYVELKAGYSIVSPWIKGLTSGTTIYWSPEYTGNTGEVFTVESAASYALPQFGIFSPSISGAYGTLYGDEGEGFSIDGDDKYSYWNAGLVLAVEKFTFDFRYWDTDIKDGLDGIADERFVFSAKVTLP